MPTYVVVILVNWSPNHVSWAAWTKVANMGNNETESGKVSSFKFWVHEIADIKMFEWSSMSFTLLTSSFSVGLVTRI